MSLFNLPESVSLNLFKFSQVLHNTSLKQLNHQKFFFSVKSVNQPVQQKYFSWKHMLLLYSSSAVFGF